MPYDCITVKLRVPRRFNWTAFAEALSRLCWDKLGMDRAQTGTICGNIEPAIVEPMFTADDVETIVRVEAGRLTEQKVWTSVQAYLTTRCGFTQEEAYVRDVSITNDLLRTELGGR